MGWEAVPFLSPWLCLALSLQESQNTPPTKNLDSVKMEGEQPWNKSVVVVPRGKYHKRYCVWPYSVTVALIIFYCSFQHTGLFVLIAGICKQKTFSREHDIKLRRINYNWNRQKPRFSFLYWKRKKMQADLASCNGYAVYGWTPPRESEYYISLLVIFIHDIYIPYLSFSWY